MIYKNKVGFFLSNLFQKQLELWKPHSKCLFSNNLVKRPWKILFFGSDDFSSASLLALLQEYRQGKLISKLEVCTSIKQKKNEIYKMAERENLVIHPWPSELKQTDFDLGLVVSFGYLIPRKIIEKFPLGMINVHASLLPRWRGAAPIIYTLANGDSQTGVTIMQVKPLKFDIGEIISQKTLEIPDYIYMPELNNKLAHLGSQELVECLKDLPNKLTNAKPQPESGISYAPKVKPSFAKINWKDMTSTQIFNLERALYGFLPLTSIWKGEIIKLFNIKKPEISCDTKIRPGFVIYDDHLKILKIVSSDRRFITVDKVQLFEKKQISAEDFNNGYLKKVPIEQRYFV